MIIPNNQITVEFLISQIGPYVEYNPVTDRPRFIQGLNGPWEAVDELGGISKVAEKFNIDEADVHEWIDNHYIPAVFANVIAKKLGYSDIEELQYPSTGYENPEAGFCWPWSWKFCCVEMEANNWARRNKGTLAKF